MMKKILAALLMLVMLLGVTATAMAAGTIKLAGVELNSSGYLDGTTLAIQDTAPGDHWAHWNSDSNTLTLHNFTREGDYHSLGGVLKGTDLTVKLDAGTVNELSGTDSTSGIYAENIKIEGTGTLRVLSDGSGYAFRAHGITVDEANVYIEAEDGSAFYFAGTDPYLKINSGTLEAKSGSGVFPSTPVTFDLATNVKGIGSSSSDGTGAVDFKEADRIGYKYVKFNTVPAAKYTVHFNSDGGTSVEPQIVIEGDKATQPADPTKEGCIFKGWTLDGAAYDFTAAVTGNIMLKAKWEKILKIYVGGVGMGNGDYLANGATATSETKPSGGYAYYNSGVLTLHNYSYKGEGYKFDPGLNQRAMVYPLQKLTLVLEGDSSLNYTDTLNVIGVYAYHLKEDFTIKGKGSLNINTHGMGVAGWNTKIESGTLGITTTYENGHGVRSNTLEVSGGAVTVNTQGRGLYSDSFTTIKGGTLNITSKDIAIALIDNNLAIEGGTINAKSTGKSGINIAGAVNMNAGTLKVEGANSGIYPYLNITGGEATLISNNTANDADYRALYNVLDLGAGMSAKASTEPDGTSPETYDSTKYETYDWIQIKAAAKYTVTFDTDGGSAVAAQTVTEGDKATQPADPTKSGYVFKGWTLAGTAYDFDTAVTADITLEAKWAALINEIDIGGVTMPVVGATPVNSATTSTPGVVIDTTNTKWVRYVAGETSYYAEYADADSTLVAETPFRAGELFFLDIWMRPQDGYVIASDAKIRYKGTVLPAIDLTDLSKSSAEVVPDGSLAYAYIRGEITYTVTFDSDGGSAVAAQTVTEGDKATQPADPTKSGYVFKGWTLAGTAYNFATPVTSDITLKATWEEIPPQTYVVTFDANGGTGSMASQTFTKGVAQALTLNAFTYEGHTFQCWNLEADGTGASYADGAVGTLESDITLYAQWQVIEAPGHEHDWDEEKWNSDDTHHWHECEGEDCDLTENSDKEGYGEHEYVDGKCVCGKDEPTEPEDPVDPVVPTIEVTPETLTLYTGEIGNVTAAVTPADVEGYVLVWSSSDESIAQVDASGVVTAIKPGKVTITATLTPMARNAGEAIADSCEVTVLEKQVDLPKTGDDSNINLWLAMLGMAGAALLMLRKKAYN